MQSPQAAQIDHFSRAQALIAEAEKAQAIDSAEKAQAATAWVGQAKTTFEVLDADRLLAGKPHRDSIASINAEYAPILEPLKAHEGRIRTMLKGWAALVMRQQEEEARRIREKNERRAAEEAARLEREALGKQREANEAAMTGRNAEAARLMREADRGFSKAETTLAHAIETPQAAPVRETAPIHSSAGTMNAQREWDWEIEDINKIPDQYIVKTVNKAALNAAVKKNNVRAIPGVRIFESAKLQIRR